MFRVVFTAFKELGPVDGSCTTAVNDFGPVAGELIPVRLAGPVEGSGAALKDIGPDIGGLTTGATPLEQISLDL